MAQKPSIPKGTRDFSPEEVARRQYIFQIIRKNFETFGYMPIETPSFENSETLMGKYGEEGDRLIFKILESGEYFEKAKEKISLIDEKTIIYLGDLLKSIFATIRESLREDCNGKEPIDKFKIIAPYIKENIAVILNNSKEISYVGRFEMFIEKFFKEFPESIAIDIVNREEFFEDERAFDNFTLYEKVKIQQFLIEYLKSELLVNTPSNKLTSYISEKALRYDLTVPFARYVVQHQNEIEFPFKRYQIQPVWRADRPQKGRFREFYQCDADVVGSTSLWQEVELVQLYDAVFSELGLEGVTIKINNRKILSGIAEVIGAKDKLIDFTVALDKLDKIGEDGVKNEMIEKGISADAIQKVRPLFSFTGSIDEKLNKLSDLLQASEEGKKGIEELRFICDNVTKLGLGKSSLDLDVTLARGLNYYTGAILEVAPPASVQMGSIGGGGRYDDLTGIFGLKNMSGVGISFGLDRIYLVIEQLNLFPETVASSTKALFLNYGDDEAFYAMQAIGQLRNAGVKTELYPDKAKIDKQFKHAERRNIPFVVMAGSDEMAEGKFKLKNLSTGNQELLDLQGLKQALA